MSNTLQIIPKPDLPANTVPPTFVQNGERSMQVYNEGQFQINNNMFIMANSSNQGNGTEAILSYLNNRSHEYYNLFVMGTEDFESGQFFIDPHRALTEYIAPEIKTLFAALSTEAVKQIKTFPSLFASENRFISGRKIDTEQKVIYGFVTDVKPQSTGIKISFQKISHFPQQAMNDLWRELDIQCQNGYGELTRTHWTIKKVNLLDELKRAELIPAQY